MTKQERAPNELKASKNPRTEDIPKHKMQFFADFISGGGKNISEVIQPQEMTKDTNNVSVINQKTQEKPFRISARRIYLTYSQVPKEMFHEDLLESLNKVIVFKNYLVAKESHATEGFHFHVLLAANTKFDIRTQNHLNVEYNGKTYHGNYQKTKTFKNCVEYICKQGDYRTDFEDVVDGKVISLEQQFLMKIAKDGIDDAQMWYIKTHPRKAAGGISMDKLTKLFYQKQDLQTKMITTEEKKPGQMNKSFNQKIEAHWHRFYPNELCQIE